MGYKLINGEAISVVYFKKLKFFIKTILRLVRVKNSDGRKKEAMYGKVAGLKGSQVPFWSCSTKLIVEKVFVAINYK